jgi:hypothetical protein
MEKYYDAWKYLKGVKSHYAKIDFNKVEEKIDTLKKKGTIIIDKNKEIVFNIIKNPGKIDLAARFMHNETKYSIKFVGVKLKGKFNTVLRKLFGIRPYFRVKNIFIGGISIIYVDAEQKTDNELRKSK